MEVTECVSNTIVAFTDLNLVFNAPILATESEVFQIPQPPKFLTSISETSNLFM